MNSRRRRGERPIGAGPDKSQSQDLSLLLFGPALSEIFLSLGDDDPISADAVVTSFGIYSAEGVKKHDLTTLPVICIGESCRLSRTNVMRLDLEICLDRLSANSIPRADYRWELFAGRHLVVVVDGTYTVEMFDIDGTGTLRASERMTDRFCTSKIIFAATTTDDVYTESLRRLEVKAQDIWANEATRMHGLPAETISIWHDFLEPIFERAKGISFTYRRWQTFGECEETV